MGNITYRRSTFFCQNKSFGRTDCLLDPRYFYFVTQTRKYWLFIGEFQIHIPRTQKKTPVTNDLRYLLLGHRIHKMRQDDLTQSTPVAVLS